jgi:tocopherol O-methyltransferase
MEQDVAAYYNQTQNHYQQWWHLSKGMALHYGLWYNNTGSFLEALTNTNKHLAELANINKGNKVLDAGCGVGGAAIYLAKNFDADVLGITLSDLQVKTALGNARKYEVAALTSFKKLDYCNTDLNNSSFDVIWACESSSSAADKQQMVEEWFRLLKPGGKLVLADFFRAKAEQTKKDHLLDKWVESWAMSPLITVSELTGLLRGAGFNIEQTNDLTGNIYRTAKRMYFSYWLGLIPSVLYNSIFGAREYARNHYKSGLYQYKGLKQALWQYHSLLAVKPAESGTIIN